MSLSLTNDLAVFDLEATGLDISQDQIIEISILKIDKNGEKSTYTKKIKPDAPISQESIEIHGIKQDDLKDAPSFSEVADEIAKFIGDADLAGFNSNKFDIPLLAEEFLRIDHPFNVANRKFVDVQNIFHKMEQRTLVAAYKFYCQKDLKDAHSAEADVIATYEVLEAQVERYDELEDNVEFLSDFSKNTKNEIADFAGRIAKNKKGELIYNFGKHKGKTIENVAKEEPGYYGWMLNGNFPRYTKAVLKEEMDRIKAVRRKKKEERKEKEEQRMESKIEKLKDKFGK